MGAFDVNYEDERFARVEDDKQEALTELDQTYSGMVGESDKYYQQQQDALTEWGEKQQQLQQEQTDFAVEQVEQQKEQAARDYKKEQSGAYADWRKQSNQYGAEAEKMASSGLDRTGFSESSQVSMYNTYQNRVAVARESYNQAVLSYDNAIKDARLQNNSALAEIAYQTLQQQLELSLQGFQYKNSLILEQANRKTELDSVYYGRYQDVLNQINTENAQKESQRQWQLSYEQGVKEQEESVRQFELELQRLKENDALDRAEAKQTAAYNRLMDMVSAGYTPTDKELSSAGLSTAQGAFIKKTAEANAIAAQAEEDGTKFGEFSAKEFNETLQGYADQMFLITNGNVDGKDFAALSDAEKREQLLSVYKKAAALAEAGGTSAAADMFYTLFGDYDYLFPEFFAGGEEEAGVVPSVGLGGAVGKNIGALVAADQRMRTKE